MSSAAPDSTPRTVRELLARGREFLERKGIESARLEVELLVAHALGTDRLHVFLDLDRPVDAEEVRRARECIVRRGKREPSAYITGEREFYVRSFEVGPGVLIPRPDTELLVDVARERCSDAATPPNVLDLGTGSGCLAITLGLEIDGARVTATDLSAKALEFARRNAERLGAEVEFLEGNGLDPVRGRRFDLIVSNPPYIDPAVRDELAVDVRDFEPQEALFAPAGDADHWAHGLALAAAGEGRENGVLTPGGTLLVELGFDQAERLGPWLDTRGIAHRFHDDLGGTPRVLAIEAPARTSS